jgi:hypothetical protein
MEYRWNVAGLMGRYKVKTGQTLIYEDIQKKTGIDRMTISNMVNNKLVSAKLKHLAALVEFFGDALGEDVGICDILVIVDDSGKLQGDD